MHLHLSDVTKTELDAVAEKFRINRTATLTRLIMEAHAREFPPVKMTTAKAYKAAEAAALAERRKAAREKHLAERGPLTAIRHGEFIEWTAWRDLTIPADKHTGGANQFQVSHIAMSVDTMYVDLEGPDPDNPHGLRWISTIASENPHVNRPIFHPHSPARAKQYGVRSDLTFAEVAEWVFANPHPEAPSHALVGFGIDGSDYRAYVKRDGPT